MLHHAALWAGAVLTGALFVIVLVSIVTVKRPNRKIFEFFGNHPGIYPED